MQLRSTNLAAAVALLVTFAVSPAVAGDIVVKDAYARVSTAVSKSGAAFMVIENTGTTPDRLIGASTDVADLAELHTHEAGANGVMKMHAIDAIVVPANGAATLARGGDHVMLRGLKHVLKQGDAFMLTLTFEKAGKGEVEVPVNLKR